MPLDVLGRTRATLWPGASIEWCGGRRRLRARRHPHQPWPTGPGNLLKRPRAGDRLLELLVLNEEFLVNASHQLALITSLPFVHTARRYYRLNDLVSAVDIFSFRLSFSGCGKSWKQRKPGYLEEVKVVTRVP